MRSFWEVTYAVAWRIIRNFISRPVVSIVPMLMPLIFFATFAGGLGALGDVPGFGQSFELGYTSFQFVFVWLQGSAFQGMFSGFLVARDYESGFARRLMIAAPNRGGILAGYLGASLVRAAIGAVVIFSAGMLAGAEFTGGALDIAVLVAIGFVTTTIASLWAAGIALRFRTIRAGPLMQMPVFIVIFLSPVFVPLALMTGWIETAAKVNPFTVLIEQARNSMAGADARGLLLAGVVAAILAAGLVWGVRGLRVAERAG